MTVPQSLPAQLFLLAYDPGRGRLTARSHLGYVLRAGALADLAASGHLADDRGKVRVASTGHVADPVLNGVLREIGDSRGRSWGAWVRRGGRQTVRAVREQLADGHWITVEQNRLLGLIPVTRVTVRDPLVGQQLAATVDAALRGTYADPRDAALTALAAAGELRTVLPRAKVRGYKQRIADLTAQAGPAIPALRKAIRDARAAAASAGG